MGRGSGATPADRPARSRVPAALVAATVAALAAMEISDARRGLGERPAGDQDAGTARWFGAAMAASLAVTAGSVLRRRRRSIVGDRRLLHAGVALTWTGIGVNRWARRDLGASYHPLVVAEAGRPLARSGPYRLVRHPMYLGSVAICAGCALLTGAPLPAAVWLLGPPSALVHRIRVEERALAAAHGDGYRSGGAAHRLVPGVW